MEGVEEEAAVEEGEGAEPGKAGLRSAGDLAGSLVDGLVVDQWERSGARKDAGDAREEGVAASSAMGLKNWTEASVEAASLELEASLEEAGPRGDMSCGSS